MAKRDESPLYLMGRLYGANGAAKSGYFPLPFETLALPSLEGKTSSHAEASCQYPIVTSNKHGRLTLLSEDKQGILTAASTSLTNSIAKETENGPAIEKVFFFPSYLLPLSQMAHASDNNPHGKDWMADLYQSLKAAAQRPDASLDEFKIQSVSVEGECLAPVTEPLLLEQTYFADYHNWYQSNQHKQICVLEVPQFYTIQVVFSSMDFAGAKVTLSDLPPSLAGLVVGNEANSSLNEPVSLAKTESIKYFDQNRKEERNSYTVATFWIESVDALALHTLQKYARIDIDLTAVEDVENLAQRGIPLEYSLKENVFQLPIHTTTGRTSVVCGDPISVEEALINHAPHFYPKVMQTLQQHPFASPEQLSAQSPKGSAELPEQAWQLLQTQKGWLEASMGAMENGLTWKTLAQVVGAATSGLTSEKKQEPGGPLDIAEKATGVTAASIDFIEKMNQVSETLGAVEEALNRPLLGRAPTQTRAMFDLADVFPSLNTSRFSSASIKPYIQKVGKAGSFLLDKPLTAVTAFYTLSQHGASKGKQSKSNNLLLDKITQYSLATSSLQRAQLASAAEQQSRGIYQEVIQALKAQLNQLSVQDGIHTTQEGELGSTKVWLDATRFEFNSAAIQALGEGENPYTVIGEKLKEISTSPFQIVITGHTCDIGNDEVNMRLSEQRAITVKNAILDAISSNPADPNRQVWQAMFVVEAKGFTQPLPGNHNGNEKERAKNRRVEILFHFATMPDYPVSRSGLYDVEKAAKAKILTDIGHNEQFISSLSAGVDLIILGAGALFPPAGAIAGAAKASLELTKQAIETVESFNSNYKVKKELENIRYQDLMMLNTFLADVDDNSIFKVHLRAYMKRQLALNGLIRLIKSSELFDTNSKHRRRTGQTLKHFSELNVFGYIEEFILSDDWDMDISFQGIEHLDEVWMENNGYTRSYAKLEQGTLAMGYSAGQAVYRSYFSNELSDEAQQKATKFSRYYPVHYRASESEATFESLKSAKPPKGLKKDVFKTIEVFVRRSYKIGDNTTAYDNWVPFEKYYQENGHQITPYDNIRIVAILDESQLGKVDEEGIPSVPVSLNAISHRTNRNWELFNTVASGHLEYSCTLDLAYFSAAEQAQLKDVFVDNKAHGVIIEPSYFFGIQRIMGVRPVTDYDDSAMKSLFDSSSKLSSSGAAKYLSYLFEIMVAGCDDTEQEIELITNSGGEKKLPRFTMTLNPTREYRLTKDFIHFSPLEKADGKFYEKSFLAFSDDEKPAQYPEVFKDAQASFYLNQEGITPEPQGNKEDNRDPLAEHLGKLRGKISQFDWNTDTIATILIRSKDVAQKGLEDMKYDPNIIPLYMSFDRVDESENRPMGEFSEVFRLGTIEEASGVFKFSLETYLTSGNRAKAIPKAVIELAQSIRDLDVESLKYLTVDKEKTVLFANVAELEYINFFGHKVKGLRPMIKPIGTEAFYESKRTGVSFKTILSAPLGSELKNVKTNTIKLIDSGIRETAIPKRWYSLVDEEKEVEIALKLNKLDSDRELAELQDKIPFKPHQNLQQWMECSGSGFGVLIDKRKDMLADWVGDWPDTN
ncbi:OmpA family protein [Vibrio hepatarius]|uniref:OmpA family protein n=1 Tax=Vibrio hepatarius TaxID=171383 RepID=UPI001C0A3A30|nr:OmpA family protein [Vibrio hepatarius]MBU2896125.1 OmpA family protein [Vibrio hepatarius]